MTRTSTVVFVPGAWLGGWSWLSVARRVAGHGFDVLTPTLPGLSIGDPPRDRRLGDAVDFLADQIHHRDLTDVVLVCHSWGGYPATAAAHRLDGRVRKVVYYNAVVPAPNTSMADENPTYGDLIRRAITATPDGTIPIDFGSVRDAMMAGDPEPLQRMVFDLMLPQPGGYMIDTVDARRVTDTGIQATYLLGSDDIALARPGTEFAARLGVQPIEVPGHHLAMLTRPDQITPTILQALSV